MLHNIRFVLIVFAASVLTSGCNKSRLEETAVKDPLPSWNEGKAKLSIIDFVTKTTKEGSPDFVPVSDRIACFDNDGTLWTEKPIPFQLYFMFDRIKALASQHPEWRTQQPFKGILEGDLKAAMADGVKSLTAIAMASQAGMTTDEFDKAVTDWIATATHPESGRHYNEMVYQPMLELLDYLRANGYKTFIVSGGGIDFIRVWAEQAYGIPPYQIVGSSLATRYDTTGTQPVLVKLAELEFYDDKLAKPVGIHEHIGKRPVFAAGNSDGDYGMLQYVSTGNEPHLGLYIHHTDSLREYFYDRAPGLARLSKGLDDAPKYNWLIVDMKTDWKKVYPYEGQSAVTAIDILLDPDQAMRDSARLYNQLMQKDYSGPGSYSLDAIHTPHITVLQCFVKTNDLGNVYDAVSKVVETENPTKQEITTSGFYYYPYETLGLAGITATASPELLRFQSRVIEAVRPYMVAGTNAAFVQNTDGTPIATGSDTYVNDFISEHSGAKYNPHVTIGLAHEEFLKNLLAKPYNKFSFKAESVSVYHLGDFGTARTKLWTTAK